MRGASPWCTPYELTPLGIEVVLTAHVLRPIHDIVKQYRRARTAAKA